MAEFWALGASEIAEGVSSGAFSAREVAESHLTRIEAANPTLNAIVQQFPEDALRAADEVDQARANGRALGPLAGVPVTIKVNVDQEGHATTNGLTLLRDLVAKTDSPVVSNLRKAGAVIIGRTNTPAFSMRWFTNNQIHGQTLNPRDTGLTPGGSSGGAASAVAAGMCAVGHGTDIAGSIRYPAYACGLHGLRPTLGRIPARNASAPDRFIGAQLMAVSGPIARSIDDIERAFYAMAAKDIEDPWWVPVPLTLENLPRRVALCTEPEGMPVAPQVLNALHRAADALRDAGWRVEERAPPPLREAADINGRLWMAEARSVADMVAREGDADAQFVFARMTDVSPEMDMPALMAALQARVDLIRRWESYLADTPVLLCPSSGELPFAQQRDVRSDGDFAAIFEAQLIQRALPAVGLPGLAVATGQSGTAPLGVQLIAPRFREDVLIAAGRVIESACGTPEVVQL
ncbi:MAG: amidase family protein [Arenibacterium sp.]